MEYDENGRCIRWGSGGGVFVEDDVKHFPVPYEQPPDDSFWVYAVVSPCGGAPPDGGVYGSCDLWRDCPDPEKERRYAIYSQLRQREPGGNYWAESGSFEYQGLWCLAKDEGGDQDLIEQTGVNNPWTTYVTLLPPGEPEIEPRDGITLVGLKTNFYTENTDPIRYDLILTTHPNDPLEVRATPLRYSWDFGEQKDQDPLLTDLPGRSYAETGSTDFDVWYEYESTGTPTIELRTEYQMEHRPPGQQWSEDAVYTSAPADATSIRVREATTRHVLGDGIYQ